MNLTPIQISIYNGSVCPYCKCLTKYVHSEVVYGKGIKDYGMIYHCQPCHAWVGVHKGTSQALGRLANGELRKAKNEAHKAFDIIWSQNYMTRTEAYEWLSDELDIDPEYCHIGMFNVATCKKVTEASGKLISTFTNK